MISTLYEALEQKKSCLVIIPHTTVEAFLHDVEQLRGHRIRPEEHTIAFIDCVDRERIMRMGSVGSLPEDEFQNKIKTICDEKNVDVIFCYFDILGEDFGLEKGLSILSPACCPQKATVIVEYLNLGGESFLESPAIRKAFDLILTIKSSCSPLPHFNYFTILYTSWSTQLRRSVPFLVKKGHIVPYIPKIVVAGPPNSGKSRFVLNATALGVSVDRVGFNGPGVTTAYGLRLAALAGFRYHALRYPGPAPFRCDASGRLKERNGGSPHR